jgi:hypothetical protein
MIYDTLKDIVAHTLTLGNIETCKITGTDEETLIDAVAEDRTVVINGRFATHIKNFNGMFGIPNLAKLNTLLNIPEYKDNAKIDVIMGQSNNETVPTSLSFENAAGDFKNNYRFMSKQLVEEKVRSVKFKGANWNVTFVPTQAAIMRLKFQSQAHSDETVFKTKIEDGNLKFFFGDASSHAGNFVFQNDVEGKLRHEWSWPIQTFISIMNLSGDKLVQFSDDGAAQITVDSGLAVYKYILPAMTK